MRNVRCPRCSHVNQADGSIVTCKKCGLSGTVGTASGAKTATEKDPWTITIDLRKANPGNWGPGAKAFAVLLMLGLAFFAGGISGVVFERARSGVISDLSGAGLLSGDNAATGPDVSDAEQLIDDPPASTPEPAPEPVPEPKADCADPTPYGCRIMTYKGQAGDAPVDIQLEKGLVGMFIDYSGDSKFALRFTEPGQSAPAATVVTDFAGKGKANYQALRYVGLDPGSYELEAAVTDGSWTVMLVYPSVSPKSPGFSHAGPGDGIVPPVAVQDEITVTLQAKAGPDRTYVVGYDASGQKVCSNGFGGQQNGETDTFKCTVSGPTTVYLDVRAPVRVDGEDSWIASIA